MDFITDPAENVYPMMMAGKGHNEMLLHTVQGPGACLTRSQCDIGHSSIDMRHIISILLENEPGALCRVAGLFSARGYNIESLTSRRPRTVQFPA